jgi:hypothetical protein
MDMMQATRPTAVRLGGRRVQVSDRVFLEGCKVQVGFRTCPEESLVSVRVPPGTAAVKICRQWTATAPGEDACPYCGKGRGDFLLCIPEEGRVHLAPMRYFYVKPIVPNEVAGVKWKLAVSHFHWEANEGATLAVPPEPLKLTLGEGTPAGK